MKKKITIKIYNYNSYTPINEVSAHLLPTDPEMKNFVNVLQYRVSNL